MKKRYNLSLPYINLKIFRKQQNSRQVRCECSELVQNLINVPAHLVIESLKNPGEHRVTQNPLSSSFPRAQDRHSLVFPLQLEQNGWQATKYSSRFFFLKFINEQEIF